MSDLDEAREYAAKALLFRGAASIRRMRLEAAIRGLLLATERQLEAIDVECPHCLSMPKEWCGEYDNSANLVLWKPPKFHSARTRLIEKLELRRKESLR